MRSIYITGPVLIGFNALFERSYGDPKTKGPYPKVIPSVVGGVQLAFPCPHCAAIRPAVVDKKTRLGYYDADRKFSWCPACRGRYVIDQEGQPLTEPLEPGAEYAPATVEIGGVKRTLRLEERGLDSWGLG